MIPPMNREIASIYVSLSADLRVANPRRAGKVRRRLAPRYVEGDLRPRSFAPGQMQFITASIYRRVPLLL